MRIFSIAFALAVVAAPVVANAGAIRNAGDFTTNTLARNDDNSTGIVGLGFSINFYGAPRTQLFVNNNGNVTFDAPLATFTPSAITNSTAAILAPFFADIDTRPATYGVTQYGTATIDGRSVFGVNWIDVGYYSQHTDLRNYIQLIITDRSDIAVGDFDFEFNYDSIQWNTGDASGGVGGFGGTPAAVGWSNGLGVGGTSYQLNGSLVDRAFIDTNASTGLINNSLNSNVLGRYIFNVRNGVVTGAVPESSTWAMMIVGFGMVGGAMRVRSRKVKFTIA
jgi:Nidogen-like